jgi:pimeloyl-ACP methyl ester carboxylesterase
MFVPIIAALVAGPPIFNGLSPAPIRPCGDGSAYYCGTLKRPLDPTGIIGGTIGIHFEWLPHRDAQHSALGVIVANEGGPGSGSTESRDAYEALFHPLLDRVDFLLVDNRGTGKSDAIDCEPLQSEPTMTASAIALCGDQLGRRAALYSTALAADDLAAVMDAMHVDKADMYGDSYGTYFTQAFAVRHPDRVRSLVLDGAYPVIGDSPWYPAAAQVMRTAYETVCKRSPTCPDTAGDTSDDRITHLVASLRAHALTGTTAIGTTTRTVTVDPSALAMVMDAAALAVVPYRELDAAARAYLDRQDPVPLLRLVGESFQANEVAGAAGAYSRGLFMAVSCADSPQAYDVRLDPDDRRAAWAAALSAQREKAPDVYAPFTIDEWVGMPPDYSFLTLCLDWPVPSALYPPGPPIPEDASFPDVPTLIISGELDTITTSFEGAAVAKLFPNSQQVVVSNSAHVDALGDPYDCASKIALTFIAVLAPGDTSCASKVPPLRLVPAFAQRVADLDPAKATSGNRAGPAELRAVNAAVQTVGDAIARESWVPGIGGDGLRGGTFRVSTFGDNAHYQFYRARFTQDLAVSGETLANAAAGSVTGSIALTGIVHGKLDFQWDPLDAAARATVTGTLDGKAVDASMTAP